ncbi:alpha/beta hydrolase family protein [Pseudoalteromonas xiamenensis]
MKSTIQITTEDHVTLTATCIESSNAKAVVLVNPGTATNTSFYLPFCEFLVANGYHIVLWNYRGFCESKTTELNVCNYRYSDIGRYDMPAVIDEVKERFPNLPLYCIGHSAGGQQIGFARNRDKLDGLIAIAVSAGYFPYMPLSYRIKANFFFRFFAPITLALFNYVPAKTFNFMEDLPRGFAKEWGAWCSEKHLFFSEKFYGQSIPSGAYKDFQAPIYVFSADDDEISTERNISNFWQHVSSEQPITYKRYDSAAFPKKSIGHFGYFRKTNMAIWHDILEVINRLHFNDGVKE